MSKLRNTIKDKQLVMASACVPQACFADCRADMLWMESYQCVWRTVNIHTHTESFIFQESQGKKPSKIYQSVLHTSNASVTSVFKKKKVPSGV